MRCSEAVLFLRPWVISRHSAALLSLKIRVDPSAQGPALTWKNRFEELDLSCTTSLCACVCVHVRTVSAQAYVCLSLCVYMSVFAAMHFCFIPSQRARFAVAGCGQCCWYLSDRLCCCAWAVCVWHSFPIQTHCSPPRPFVADVSCQQTGRFAGWWRKSQRAEKQTGRSPDLLGLSVWACKEQRQMYSARLLRK